MNEVEQQHPFRERAMNDVNCHRGVSSVVRTENKSIMWERADTITKERSSIHNACALGSSTQCARLPPNVCVPLCAGVGEAEHQSTAD